MKKTLVIIAAGALGFVGCQRDDTTMDESAGAQKDQIEQNKDAQQESLDQQKDQINAEARAQKDSIEAQSDAEKAQLDAQKKQLEAEAKAQKAQAEAQQDTAEAQAKADREVQESAGAVTEDRDLETRIRTTLFGDQATATTQSINIAVKEGKVTLTGTVKTQAEKDQWEQKAKSVSGVQSVDNKLKVQE